MNENVETLIFCGVAFAIGMAVGQFLSFRRKRDDKIALEVESKELWVHIGQQTAWILVVVLFMASVLQSVLFTYTQRQCNVDMVETIKYRASITQDDSKLNEARANALKKLVDDVIASTAITDELERGQFVRQSFLEYHDVTDRLNAEKRENEKKRAERPYPECL